MAGHASASANFEVYLAVYFLWTVFYRRWRRSGEDLEPLMSAGRRGCRAFWHDVGEGFAVLWIIFNVRTPSFTCCTFGRALACAWM